MIISAKTKQALLKEVSLDVDWLTARNGLWKKYSKQLKSKAIKIDSILGWSKYTTPSGNIAHLCSIKNVHNGIPSIEHAYLFEYREGYLEPVFDNERVKSCVFYTKHCIQRIEERSGMSFVRAFEVSTKTDIGYTDYSQYGYNGTECLRYFCNGFLICNYDEAMGICCAITYVNSEQAYSNQAMSMLISKKVSDTIFEEHQIRTENEYKRLPRSIRRQIIRSI